MFKKNLLLLLVTCFMLLTACSEQTTEESTSSDVIDYDLTEMSATMVYSQVFDLVSNPTNYEGKTFKIEGIFEHYMLMETDEYIYFVVVTDATACCPQGIELSLSENITIPEDYSEVVIEGEVEMYEAFDGNSYVRVKVNSLNEL